ncbi:MAG: LacI family DNA-binding transcriptional regulator [Thermomicrobiales bacterium]
MTKPRVTIDDVASASRTSPATVSLVLRNKPGVRPETRERVLSAAQQLGYVRGIRAGPPEDGRGLRNVALIFRTWDRGPDRRSPALNPFYSWVLAGIQEAGTESSFNLILGTIPIGDDFLPREVPEATLRQPLDGVLLVGAYRPEAIEQVLDLLGNPRPSVVLVDSTDTSHGLDTVTSDHEFGGWQATSFLIAQGHREIAYAGPRSDWDDNFRLRKAGWHRAMTEHGLATDKVFEAVEPEIIQAQITTIASEATATFGANDDMALALLRGAQAAHIRVPEQHSMIGFDDTSMARDAHPGLTTMAVDKLALGRMAVQLLEHRIRWPESSPLRLATVPQLIERGSVAPPNAASATQ